MVGSTEWGPKNHEQDTRNLVKVAQFSAPDLRDIGAGVTSYLEQNRQKKRAHAAQHTARKGLPLKRVQAGLDVLNQLGAIGKSWNDVHSIEIYEDTSSTIEQ